MMTLLSVNLSSGSDAMVLHEMISAVNVNNKHFFIVDGLVKSFFNVVIPEVLNRESRIIK